MTENQSIDESDEPRADVWYYGVNAIAKRMGWSTWKVMTANQQMAFPLVRLPSSHGKHWVYATSDLLIEKWLHVQTGMAYDYVAHTALGRKLRATRGTPAPAPTTTDDQPPAADGGGVKPPSGQGD